MKVAPRIGLRVALAVDRLVLLDCADDFAVDSPVQIVFLPVKLQERQLRTGNRTCKLTVKVWKSDDVSLPTSIIWP